MTQLPAWAPQNAGDAFAHINAVTHPTIDDLKLMVFLEASGQSAYFELAASTENAGVKALLEANGRAPLYGCALARPMEGQNCDLPRRSCAAAKPGDFPPPRPADNRYAAPAARKVDRALLGYLVTAANNGNTLYETWASNTANADLSAEASAKAEAAALFRQNGREEVRHGERAAEAARLLG